MWGLVLQRARDPPGQAPIATTSREVKRAVRSLEKAVESKKRLLEDRERARIAHAEQSNKTKQRFLKFRASRSEAPSTIAESSKGKQKERTWEEIDQSSQRSRKRARYATTDPETSNPDRETSISRSQSSASPQRPISGVPDAILHLSNVVLDDSYPDPPEPGLRTEFESGPDRDISDLQDEMMKQAVKRHSKKSHKEPKKTLLQSGSNLAGKPTNDDDEVEDELEDEERDEGDEDEDEERADENDDDDDEVDEDDEKRNENDEEEDDTMGERGESQEQVEQMIIDTLRGSEERAEEGRVWCSIQGPLPPPVIPIGPEKDPAVEVQREMVSSVFRLEALIDELGDCPPEVLRTALFIFHDAERRLSRLLDANGDSFSLLGFIYRCSRRLVEQEDERMDED